MREIKFRGWDKQGNCMVDWGTMRQTAFNRGDSQLMYDIFTNRLDLELMQFTGLKDKNGKEIYENDILNVPEGYSGDRREDEHISVVEWCVDGTDSSEGFFISKPCDVNWQQCEIIGNIYENPELVANGK